MPAFRHPPIWKEEPHNQITVMEGENVTLKCEATVGPQYDSYRMQPVRASWFRQNKVKLKEQ